MTASFDTMDTIAYYLSEYDMKAFQRLGFDSQASGFRAITGVFGRKDSYLRRLRDEYDVVTSSHRNGQKNRTPRPRIVEAKTYLSTYSFNELSIIVESLIQNASPIIETESDVEVVRDISEDELERIINAKDSSSKIEYRLSTTQSVRVYDRSIISGLKALYKGHCQLCGCLPLPSFYCDISEAHHIEYFSKTQNNDASNIIIVCPNHHRIIHKLNPVFNDEKLEYISPDGMILKIKLNCHIIEKGKNNG